MTATELVGWLLVQGIDLGAPDKAEARIWKWRQRHPDEIPVAPRDPANPKDRRTRYSSAGVLAVARRKLGQDAVPAQRGASSLEQGDADDPAPPAGGEQA
jgi:hypothetical protein